MANIQIDDQEVLAALQRLQERSDNIRPFLLEVGEDLAESSRQRFYSSTDPDGEAWLSNSMVTLDRKEGSRPLIDHDYLAASLVYQPHGDYGSPLDQAAMMQFGDTKAEFPHLWGDIPARPFLGLSSADAEHLLDLAEDYFL